ncbi:MAG: hypothetical protein H0V26_03305 [Solirubrobacterales bacterium]|nr:hypothetical protein [Solirubrobacterales bacterium]
MRVVIADDNLLVRQGITSLLREAGIEVAAQADSAEGLLRAAGLRGPPGGRRFAVANLRIRFRAPPVMRWPPRRPRS